MTVKFDPKTLHNIAEWEECVKHLPVKVEFSECHLQRSLVTSFFGRAFIDGKWVYLRWNYLGECSHNKVRLPEYDIKFNFSQK